MKTPRVTVLVPVRNEVADLPTCLAHVLSQSYPSDSLEVVVVDGGSTDGTAELARSVLGASVVAWQVVDNPAATTPSNLNAGLAVATGDLLCRVDARTWIRPDHVHRCVEILTARTEVAVAGGAQVAIPRDDGALAVGIARALNNRWTMGGSRYRRGSTSGTTDTVFMGAFRVADLRAVGGWDERFESNQDFDLNRRLRGDGRVVWFEAHLDAMYLPRRSFAHLWAQYVRFGRWKVRYWRLTGDRPQVRQMALIAAGPGAGLVALGLLRTLGIRPTVSLLLGALAVVEVGGARVPASRDLRAHATAMAAIICVSLGWSLGLWRELLRR